MPRLLLTVTLAGALTAAAIPGVTIAARPRPDRCGALARSAPNGRLTREAGMFTRTAPDGRVDIFTCVRRRPAIARVYSVPAPLGPDRVKVNAFRLSAWRGAFALTTTYASGDRAIRLMVLDVRRPRVVRAIEATTAQPTASHLTLLEVVLDSYGRLLWRAGVLERSDPAAGDEVRADAGNGVLLLDRAPPHTLHRLHLRGGVADWIHGDRHRHARLP